MAERRKRVQRRRMPSLAARFGAEESSTSLFILFVPSKDRLEEPIDQRYWTDEALMVLGGLFGGATAYPQGRGVWRDDAQGGKLLYDEPVVIQCYTSERNLRREAPRLREFLVRMGTESHQGAVGFVVDGTYMEIRFPISATLER